MSLAIRLKMAVFAAGFGLGASAVWGQVPLGGVRHQSLLSQTVSVSTLQVPAKAWKHFDKARNAAEHNRPDESQQESTKAIEIAPNFAKAYLLRASQEIHQQRFDEAISDAAAATKIEPGVFWSATILAGAYNSTRRYKDALLVLDNLRGPETETWQAKYERARAGIGIGDVEASLYWTGLAVQAAPPGMSDVCLLRTNALLLAHRWLEAQSQMKIYLQSKGPQTHRDEVLALLKIVQTRIDGDKAPEMASR